MATKSSTQEMESLVINKVASPAVYQSMVTNNQINENELYLVMGDENVTYTLSQSGDTITLTGSDGSTSSVSADASGTASSAVSAHNSSSTAHSDIRNAIPTATSDLTNDSGFITTSDIPEGAAASTTTPKMDGTATIGTELAFARGDHVHPTDTSRAPTSHAISATTYGVGTASTYGHLKLSDSTSATSSTSDGIAATPAAVKAAYDLANSKTANTGTVANVATGDGLTGGPITTSGTISISYGTVTPSMNGTGAVGTATTASRSDHVHPTDTSRAAAVHSHDAATTSAAGFMSAADKTKLDAFLDEDQYMAFRGYAVSSSEFTDALSDITAEGHYHILVANLASITDLPEDFDANSGAHLIVWDATDGSNARRFQILMDVNGSMWQRFVSASSGIGAWVNFTGLYNDSDLIGRNLFKNVLVPNVGSNATLPMLVGQTEETKTTTGTWSVAEHGFRLTNTGNQRPIIRFGANTIADGTMNGLTAGETYTMSFDYACQLYGGYSGSSNVYLRVYLYSNAANASAFGIDSSANVATYSSGEYGNVKTGSCVFTFTIPSAATMIDFRVQANETTNSYFPSGSYVELSNLKLEKGYRATAWYPAVEDLDKQLPTNRAVTLTAAGWSSNAQTVTVTGVSATETAQLITITPAIASQSDYLAAGVKATAQAANSITFSCDTTPTVALTVYLTIQEVAYAS